MKYEIKRVDWDGTKEGLKLVTKETGVEFQFMPAQKLHGYEGDVYVRGRPPRAVPVSQRHPGVNGPGSITFVRSDDDDWMLADKRDPDI